MTVVISKVTTSDKTAFWSLVRGVKGTRLGGLKSAGETWEGSELEISAEVPNPLTLKFLI